MHRRPFALLFLSFVVSISGPRTSVADEAPIDFSRSIRPILSDKCFRCHGPDSAERSTSLRLDQRTSALTVELDAGGFAVVPGDADASELMRRIRHEDPDLRMPPPDSGKQVTAEERELIAAWIEQGAAWEDHWAFTAPSRPRLPRSRRTHWSRNAIDRFVLAKLEADTQLEPSPQADRHALIRRVTLDLTGLPPTPAETKRFVNDDAPDAYERLVDRLLSSPRYGEHQAHYWLDVARYGDTHGLHLDNERSIWPYREWVVHAFNSNKPFDEFTIEQLAGDLLPDATVDQQVATGFHRCNVTTSEGGSIDQEYLVRYAVDRVETTATTWLGLTAGCAACHDHKFDPLSQKEFYQLFSFFYSASEKAMDRNALLPPPSRKVPTRSQRAAQQQLSEAQSQLQSQIERKQNDARQHLAQWAAEYLADDADRGQQIPGDVLFHCPLDEQDGTLVHASGRKQTATSDRTSAEIRGTLQKKSAGALPMPAWDMGRIDGGLWFDGKTYVTFPDVCGFRRDQPFTLAAWVYLDGDQAMTVVSRMNDRDAFRGYDLYISEGKVYTHIIHRWPGNAIRVNTSHPIVKQKWQHVCIAYDGSSSASGVAIYIDGQRQPLNVTHDTLSGSIENKEPLRIGTRQSGAAMLGMLDDIRIYDRMLLDRDVAVLANNDPLRPILDLPQSQWTTTQQSQILEQLLPDRDAEYRQLLQQKRTVDNRLRRLEGSFPSTLVMEELSEPRRAYVLKRGEYDRPQEPVDADVPAVLPPLPQDADRNRLSLARWIVDSSNPLTARVIVNRVWQQYFGIGIVGTPEDFGSQGEWPSHPKLLDWLAVEFVESGWDVKALHRLIATSATYRQSAVASSEAYQSDPQNRKLARGPRFRADAEVLRDQALFAAGLLVERVGGKSVRPYQPAGLWEAVGYTSSNTAKFQRDSGADLYRRSLYTFWKRTSPPPGLQILDAPSREVCTARRARTNTPTAALTLMNDVQYVEAARALAARTLRDIMIAADDPQSFVPDDDVCIRGMFRRVLTREPMEVELKVIRSVLQEFRAEFSTDPGGARQLVSQGESQTTCAVSDRELAAWTMVANMILNLDEALVK